MPKDANIVNSAVTGYGESLTKAALSIDIGEVETVAHYKAAEFFSAWSGIYIGYWWTGYEMS